MDTQHIPRRYTCNLCGYSHQHTWRNERGAHAARGRSRLRQLMLGNVSEEIVARAAGNVYLVPPPQTA